MARKRPENLLSEIETPSNCNIIKTRPVAFAPTPSTLVNLACTDDIDGGLPLGKMVNLIGDSSTGKSFFSISMFAEMDKRQEFSDYVFVYDDAEWANMFDMNKLFGPRTASRIVAPNYDNDSHPIFSRTIEDFHCYVLDMVDKCVPFIYILDSFDALDADADKKKIKDMRTARRKGAPTSGSYQMSKPKKASELLRNTVDAISETDSLLIIVSQTRDNIDPFSFERVTRSGGRALKFYASIEMWFAHAGKNSFPRRSDWQSG
jgi:RecA/RadA recombinase